MDNFSTTESAVVGALLADNSLYYLISDIVSAEDFVDSNTKLAFKKMVEMIEEKVPADYLTVAHQLGDSFCSEGLWIGILCTMQVNTFAPQNIKEYAKIVRQKSDTRRTAKLITESQGLLIEPNHECLDHLIAGANKIKNNIPVEAESYKDQVKHMIHQLDEQYNRKSEHTGIATGFSALDELTHGLHNGDLIVLAARPSMGKTALALNIMDHISCVRPDFSSGLPVMFFSLETKAEFILKRTLARLTKIDGSKILGANFEQEAWDKILAAQVLMAESNLFINDKYGISVAEMEAICVQRKHTHGLRAVFVDHMSLIGSGKAENETMRITNISGALKNMARHLDVPVFVLSQLNRDLEKRPDRRPMMSDLRQSGAIEQDADVIMFLYRESQYNENYRQQTEAELNIAKHRNGETKTLKLNFDKKYCEFTDWKD